MVSTRKRKERRSPRFARVEAPDAARSNLSGGRPKTWVKSKNPASDAVRREREEEWR
jgi:hypothetical protein